MRVRGLGRLRRALPFTRRRRLTRKVAARKRARAASPHRYAEAPTVSAIIQSFNHRANVSPIVERLRRAAIDELIVCEDGSVDGSEKRWRAHLTRPNDFLIQSNDLHEIRTYNRAVSYARGTYVAMLQDDDIPPADPGWVTNAVTLFETFPELAVLGCWNGWRFDFSDFERSIGSPLGSGVSSDQTAAAIPSVEPRSGIPFAFVEAVGIGPFFVRRSAFHELGGFDERLSGPGEPGIWLDYELCLRAWTTGLQVGLFGCDGFRRNVGGQGTVMFGNAKRFDNYWANLRRVEREYAGRSGAIRRIVDERNHELARAGNVPGGR